MANIATLTVQVQPELPDDFAATVNKAVRVATAEAHLSMAAQLLWPGTLDEVTDAAVQEHFDGIYAAMHPEAGESR